jgi:ATP-dependent Zn protease
VLTEARVLLEQAQARVHALLGTNRARLDALATALMEREVLSGPELGALLGERALA